MINRGQWVGTFPDSQTCCYIAAVCGLISAVLFGLAVLSWIKGK